MKPGTVMAWRREARGRESRTSRADAWLLRGAWASSNSVCAHAWARDRLSRRRLVAIVAAALVAIAFAAVPADARTKGKKQYRDETPSLDGRTTGQLRTCGYDTLQYGSGGTPRGPYCH